MNSSTPAPDTLPPRDRILMAAHALFYGEGIRATGVDRVIDQASVSKVTFYRQYASKDDLIRAYLDYRHDLWIDWLEKSLGRETESGRSAPDALATTLRSWFARTDFRGCAFLNAAAELGSSDPSILKTVRQHKSAMSSVLERHFDEHSAKIGEMVALLVDGAIVHAQMGRSIDEVIEALAGSITAILHR